MRSSCALFELHADCIEEIGMEIRGDPDAIRMWKEAGADIERDTRVRVPAGSWRGRSSSARRLRSSFSTRATPRAR